MGAGSGAGPAWGLVESWQLAAVFGPPHRREPIAALRRASQSQLGPALRLGLRLETVPGLCNRDRTPRDWLSRFGTLRVGPVIAGRETFFLLAARPRC